MSLKRFSCSKYVIQRKVKISIFNIWWSQKTYVFTNLSYIRNIKVFLKLAGVHFPFLIKVSWVVPAITCRITSRCWVVPAITCSIASRGLLHVLKCKNTLYYNFAIKTFKIYYESWNHQLPHCITLWKGTKYAYVFCLCWRSFWIYIT